ncbi:AIPR protein [Acinetobacter sp. NRRL B-65365]|nr:AIPR protein [Acinetobacter sp. NRRL B-65365]
MDRITKSLIEELLKNWNLETQGEARDFENFVNYSIISHEYNKTFSLDELSTGGGQDTGLDGVAIVVNGQILSDPDEAEDFLSNVGNNLEVDYIFTQSKTSSNFNASEIGTFLFGVEDFFSEENRLPRNEIITKLALVSNLIFDQAAKFRRNPNVKIYYVTTGSWKEDDNLQSRINYSLESLSSTNLFNKINFYSLGAQEISKLYRKSKESISTTFQFSNRITIPDIKGVTEAYIGLLPYNEFLKIVSDEEQNLLNVFEDNVRDFQGENNDVNSGIANTIISEGSEIFSVLNNGVTIVANNIALTGNQFTISDYQIVNGCQTSNVLYNSRGKENIQKVNVPIKLIATTDDDIKIQITLATNNQTPIKKEQLASLTQFQRRLEDYYNSYEGDFRLYYERRAKQYNSDTSVLKSKIITVPYQIKSFVAMFLDEPHNVTSFFGLIVRRLNDGKIKVFHDDHKYFPYYLSAYAYYKLDYLFKRGQIDPSYKKVKFHFLMLFRILNEPYELPNLNSKKIEDYCETLFKILNDPEKCIIAFNRCIEIVDRSGFIKSDKQDVKLVSKTKILIDYCNNLKDTSCSANFSLT